ncbi:MAG: response regulator [Polyangiaceae bacterium]|jgi:CheY-like chemotaxis protein|nr:response regulator [Polyangiaceae bacterium]
MKILVVDDSRLEARAVADLLIAQKHQVAVVDGGREALARYKNEHFPVVITDWLMSGVDGHELTQRLRDLDTPHYIYVIMLTSNDSAANMRRAYEAGVDDFMTKPLRPEEMLARLRVAERTVRLEEGLRKRVEDLESALRRLDASTASRLAEAASAARRPTGEGSPSDDPIALARWGRIGPCIVDAMSKFLNVPFKLERGGSGLRGEGFAMGIPLSDPERQLEMLLVLLVDQLSAVALAEELFGPGAAEPEMIRDVFAEAANMSAGALKAALETQKVNTTVGLPVPREVARLPHLMSEYSGSTSFTLSSPKASVSAYVAVRRRRNITVRATELSEGMVLSADLRDEKGVLLIRAGTRLSATAASRLARLGPKLMVQLTDPNVC